MTEYTHKSIKTIDELIEHIRQNVGMYAGETETPIHLFEECFTNALDETIANYCNIVAVNVDEKNNIYEIVDNGRGIPIDEDVPILISTKFSGAKFKNSKNAYHITSGKHGTGLVVVNALTFLYQIEIYRDNKYAIFRFENGKLVNKEITKYKDKVPFSTKITFQPDPEYFNEKNIPFDKIRNRLLTASVELQNCTFVLNSTEREREVIKLDKTNFFKQNCLNSDNDFTDFLEIESKDKYESFNILLSYSKDGPVSPKIISSLNVLPVEDGGTHINIFYNILKDILVSKAKKYGYRIQPADCLVRLRAYLSVYIEYPEFGAQSKDKVTNKTSYFDKLSKKLKKDFEDKFQKNEEQLIDILENLHLYRKNLDSKKFRNKNNNKRGSTKFTKLKDCSSNSGELFVVEGDSAAGTLQDARDSNIHAILPLKGKIPSILNKDVVLKNTEVKELIQTLGTGIMGDFDISKLRYSKIICATDADPDGNHIFVLLTMILFKLVPGIIKDGRFFLVRTPLRAINEKNVFIPLWTEQEYNEAINNNRKVTRFKGLGELNAWQLKICALDEDTRRLIQVNYPKDENKILKIFNDVNERRKLLVDDNVKLFKDI